MDFTHLRTAAINKWAACYAGHMDAARNDIPAVNFALPAET